jgi:hypothetical protein
MWHRALGLLVQSSAGIEVTALRLREGTVRIGVAFDAQS